MRRFSSLKPLILLALPRGTEPLFQPLGGRRRACWASLPSWCSWGSMVLLCCLFEGRLRGGRRASLASLNLKRAARFPYRRRWLMSASSYPSYGLTDAAPHEARRCDLVSTLRGLGRRTIISDDQDRFRALTLSASGTPRIFSFALRSLIQASSP
jgi:hypothetical protein